MAAPAPTPRLHRAYVIAAVTLGALVAAAAFRSSTGVLLEPIEREFGWTRATTSAAVSLNLVIYGLVAPFAAAVMESWGVRRTVSISLLVVGAASALTCVMTAPWQLWLLWGLLIGVGTGAMALTFGAIIANRWFDARRGLVTGIFSAANATGQLLFLPAIAAAASGPGWRYAALAVAALAVLMAVLVMAFLRDRPADVGLRPYGAELAEHEPDATPANEWSDPAEAAPGAEAVRPQLVEEARSPFWTAIDVLIRWRASWAFWALLITFFVCGWSTNGLVQTHFVPAAHDHGMPQTTAAWLLALVGIFDIIGTIASGWLTDRMDSRVLLAVYYAGRGLSLLFVNGLLAATIEPPMWAFIVFYGLDWVATVPPTVALCRKHFGMADSGVAFGWTFAAHMVGAGIGASVAGQMRTHQGTYELAWLTAAVLCFAASVIALSIPRHPIAERIEHPHARPKIGG